MSNRKIFFGVILIFLGLILTGRTFDIIYFSFGDLLSLLIPLGLIALGIWLMLRNRNQERAAKAEFEYEAKFGHDRPEPPPERATPPEPPPYEPKGQPPPGAGQGPRVSESPRDQGAGKLRYSKFIGDMFIDCSGVDLRNVEINNFLGDVEVKLHDGVLHPGLNRMIISGFIGDVRVLVPQGMAVFAQSSNFIGDIEMMGRKSGGFGNSIDAQTPDYNTAEAKLYVATNHFIGDVRVYVV